MSSATVLAVLGAGLALLFAGARIAEVRRIRRKEREEKALATAPTRELLERIDAAITYERWNDLAAARRLRALPKDCTDVELLAALEGLATEACALRPINADDPRDSNFFELYESGLARIEEVLRARTR